MAELERLLSHKNLVFDHDRLQLLINEVNQTMCHNQKNSFLDPIIYQIFILKNISLLNAIKQKPLYIEFSFYLK
jgi:hypothetical protein